MNGYVLRQVSDEKREKIRLIFNETLGLFLKIAASQVRRHSTTIWSFLKWKLKLYLYNLQIHQESNELDKKNRMWFARDCRSGQRSSLDFFIREALSDEHKFSQPAIVNKQQCWVWDQNVQKKFIKCQTAKHVVTRCAVSKKSSPTLVHRRRKFDTSDMQKSSSVLCVSKTSKVPITHHFSEARFSFTALSFCASVWGPKVP